jgi:hypothetical protein
VIRWGEDDQDFPVLVELNPVKGNSITDSCRKKVFLEEGVSANCVDDEQCDQIG